MFWIHLLFKLNEHHRQDPFSWELFAKKCDFCSPKHLYSSRFCWQKMDHFVAIGSPDWLRVSAWFLFTIFSGTPGVNRNIMIYSVDFQDFVQCTDIYVRTYMRRMDHTYVSSVGLYKMKYMCMLIDRHVATYKSLSFVRRIRATYLRSSPISEEPCRRLWWSETPS